MIKKSGLFHFIDKSGNRVVDPVYDQVSRESEFWEVKMDEKTGFLDSTESGKWGFVDKNGNVVVPLIL